MGYPTLVVSFLFIYLIYLRLSFGLFFAAFLLAFFADFFFADVEAPGLTTAISLVPMGEPRPVQASQPGPALKPTGVPE